MKRRSIIVTLTFSLILYFCTSSKNENSSTSEDKESTKTSIATEKKNTSSITDTNISKEEPLIKVEEVITDKITDKPHSEQEILAYYLEDYKGEKKFVKETNSYVIEWTSTENLGDLGSPYTSESKLKTFIIESKKVGTKFVYVIGTEVKGSESEQIHFGYVVDNNDYENEWKLDQMHFTIRTTDEPLVDIYLLGEYRLGFGFEEKGEHSSDRETDNLVIYTKKNNSFYKVFSAPLFDRNLTTDANGDEVWTALTGRIELLNKTQDGYRNINFHKEGAYLNHEGILDLDYSDYESYYYQNGEYVNIH